MFLQALGMAHCRNVVENALQCKQKGTLPGEISRKRVEKQGELLPFLGLRQRSACRHAHQNFVEKGRKICVLMKKVLF